LVSTFRLLTADDLFHLPSDQRCELIDGVLVDLSPPGPEHAGIAGRFTTLLGSHVLAEGLGEILVEPGIIVRREPDTVRAPDVAFVRADRIPDGGLPATFWDVVPDLVLEVVSPNDTQAEIQAKVREWVEAGVRLVLVAYPREHSVHAIRSLIDRQVLTGEDTLDARDIVPGFEFSVGFIFGPQRRATRA